MIRAAMLATLTEQGASSGRAQGALIITVRYCYEFTTLDFKNDTFGIKTTVTNSKVCIFILFSLIFHTF